VTSRTIMKIQTESEAQCTLQRQRQREWYVTTARWPRHNTWCDLLTKSICKTELLVTENIDQITETLELLTTVDESHWSQRIIHYRHLTCELQKLGFDHSIIAAFFKFSDTGVSIEKKLIIFKQLSTEQTHVSNWPNKLFHFDVRCRSNATNIIHAAITQRHTRH